MFNFSKVKINFPRKLIPFLFLSEFSSTDTDDSQDGRGRKETFFLFHSTTSTRSETFRDLFALFHSTTSTHSQTFRQLFAILHMRRVSHIFNCNVCIYHAATRWVLPPYRITISFIDYVILFFVCLLDDLILGFSPLYYKQTD